MVQTERYAWMLKYQGVVFDLDGTLVDSMPLHMAAWHKVFAGFGIEPDDAFLLAHGGVPSRETGRLLLEMYGITDQDPDDLARLKTEYYVKTLPQVKLFPGVEEMLKCLKNAGVRMAVGTGTTAYNMLYIIEYTPLKNYIEAGVCAEDVVKHKPAPDTFIEAALRIGCTHENALVAEDTPLGITAAHAGGFEALLVRAGNPLELTSADGKVLKRWN